MERLEQWVREGAVETVIVAGIDMQGRLYGKRCVAKAFLQYMTGGIHTCDCNFGWDIERQLIDGLEFTGWHKGYGDMLNVPDWSTLRLWPWFEKTALVLCDTRDHAGGEIDVAPRTILARQVAKAAALGFEVKMAPELEFFLFKETIDSSRAKRYNDLEPASRYISDYSIFRSSMDDWVLGEIRRLAPQAGIELEGNKAEWGHGQVEFNLVYDEATRMADNHAIFKNACREIAALNGVQLTFMAKWNSEHSGNGCHVHVSLWKDGGPAFPGTGEHHMSPTMRHFLGGMMHLAKDLQVFLMPNVNSYKRIEPLSFAPYSVAWGGDNRTPSFRIAGHGPSMRLENRIAGADANAHLLYSAMIGSGLYGIEHKLEPIGPYVTGNAYDIKTNPHLHRTLTEAADAFERSTVAREILGGAVVDHYTRVARWEVEQFQKYVTDWERNRYFELI